MITGPVGARDKGAGQAFRPAALDLDRGKEPWKSGMSITGLVGMASQRVEDVRYQ
jgi:hypothetical protein